MNVSRLICLVFFILSSLIATAQIYTINDIDKLLKYSEKDSIAQIERVAALEFHKLINNYRESNDLSSLKWDESLWVATRNHNLWMLRENNLSHTQTKNNKYFTGRNPGDRFLFAEGGTSNCYWSGENALYNFSAYGLTINEIAKNIAKSSFKQWKNSPGHNRNMLGKSHLMHGTAFIIGNGKVWGTDLFSSSNRDQLQYEKPLYVKTKPKRKTRFSTFKTKRKMDQQLQALLRQDLGVKLKKTNKDSEAKRQARNLLSKRLSKQNNNVLSSSMNRTNTKGFFGLFSMKKYTYSLVLEKPVSDFNSNSVTDEIISFIKENQPINPKRKMDVGIALRKRKNNIRVTMVSILYNPKSTTHIF